MDANELIDAFGGPAKTAKLFELTVSAVSQWREKNRIPPARLMCMRLMRPELFPVGTEITDKAA